MNDQSHSPTPEIDQDSIGNLKRSALYDIVTRHSGFDFDHHVATTPRGGYDVWNDFCLPMAYSEPIAEYNAIRNGCGLFDASPMTKYRFRGSDAGLFLNRILTSQVTHLPPMKAAYGLMCNEDGLLLDDGIVLKFAEDDYLFLITEQNHDAYFAKYNRFDDLVITEESLSFCGLALQGPESCAVLSQFGFDDVQNLKPFSLRHYDLTGHRIILGRLGFTGDLGYEIWFHPDALPAVERALDKAEETLGVKLLGYGLTAVQICRQEAGMIVPGWDTAGTFQDRDAERTPFELSLGWNVKLNREDDFVGKGALVEHKATGPLFIMKGFVISETCKIEDKQKLFADVNGKRVEIGTLPSKSWHVCDQKWIGFASVKASYANVASVYIIDGVRKIRCSFNKLPMLNLARRNAVPAPCDL